MAKSTPQAKPVGDFHVFIPSRGRFHQKRATWHVLAASGLAFTVVVEPQEAEHYQSMLEDVCRNSSSKWSVEVLPSSNQGVSFVRNHIHEKLAPQGDQWFWVMDDDIRAFYRFKENDTKAHHLSAADCFAEVRNTHMRSCPNASAYALEYRGLAWGLSGQTEATIQNSYTNIAVAFNRSRVPPGIRYRFPVREDLDFNLQLIAAGKSVCRIRRLAFDAPQMNTAVGGMTEYYQTQLEDIRKQNAKFIETWPAVAKEVVKGVYARGTLRYDIKVLWEKLNPLKWRNPTEVLRGTVFLGSTEETELQRSKRLQMESFTAGEEVPEPEVRRRATKAARRHKGRRRRSLDDFCSNITSSSEEDDEDEEDDSDFDGSSSSGASFVTTSTENNMYHYALVPRKKPAPRAPRPKVEPGWGGWEMLEYRTSTPAIAAHAGLKVLADGTDGSAGKEENPSAFIGRSVAVIPWDMKLSPLMEGTVISEWLDAKTGAQMWEVMPSRKFRGVPSQKVSLLMDTPEDWEVAQAALEKLYCTSP